MGIGLELGLELGCVGNWAGIGLALRRACRDGDAEDVPARGREADGGGEAGEEHDLAGGACGVGTGLGSSGGGASGDFVTTHLVGDEEGDHAHARLARVRGRALGRVEMRYRLRGEGWPRGGLASRPPIVVIETRKRMSTGLRKGLRQS